MWHLYDTVYLITLSMHLLVYPFQVLELKKERERALKSRTLAGHAQNLMGYLLSAYCLYKCANNHQLSDWTVISIAGSDMHW